MIFLDNVVYMHLAEKLTLDFRTISDFRKNNPDIIKTVFKFSLPELSSFPRHIR